MTVSQDLLCMKSSGGRKNRGMSRQKQFDRYYHGMTFKNIYNKYKVFVLEIVLIITIYYACYIQNENSVDSIDNLL